jgi:hypothetical protein
MRNMRRRLELKCHFVYEVCTYVVCNIVPLGIIGHAIRRSTTLSKSAGVAGRMGIFEAEPGRGNASRGTKLTSRKKVAARTATAHRNLNIYQTRIRSDGWEAESAPVHNSHQ